MNTTIQGADPRLVNLQWFADEGNPPADRGQGAEDAGSFVAGLTQETPGSAEGNEGKPPAQEAAPKEAPKESPKQTVELPGYAAGLTKDLKADPRAQGYVAKFKNMDEVIRAGMEAESKIGSMVSVPGKDAKPEERAAFFKKVGLEIPDNPDGYELEWDKRLEKDPEAEKEYRALAHQLGFTKDQAKRFHALTQEKAIAELTSYRESQAQAKKEVETALKKEYGDDYPSQVENVRRALRAYGSADLARDIEDTGIGNRASFIRLLASIGKITREDSAAARPGAGGGEKNAADLFYPNQGKKT